MSLPLPTLDDRRWADLVEEGRALIPLYGPDWTDHNIHDPGIMLIDLLAWVTEMDIYWLNQVPDEHKRKFLPLAGIWPRPPQPAQTLFQFHLSGSSAAWPLPASCQIVASQPAASPLTFETVQAISLVPGSLAAIQREEASQFIDLTGPWQRGEPFLPWGPDPKPGDRFYLGLTQPLPDDAPATLYFRPVGPRADETERQRIMEELARRAAACPPPQTCEAEPAGVETAVKPAAMPPLVHHDVHLEWSYWTGSGQWQPLDAGSQVQDGTRALTLDGPIVFDLQEQVRPIQLFSLPRDTLRLRKGKVPNSLRRQLDCRGAHLPPDAQLTKGKDDGWIISDAKDRTLYHLVKEDSEGETGYIVYRYLYAPAMVKRSLGDLEEPYYYLRCQIAYGAFDKAPELAGVILNGVLARQAAPVGQATWTIAPDAQLPADAPRPGQVYPFHFELDGRGRITRLDYPAGPAPRLRVLAYQPPNRQGGMLTVEAIWMKDPGGTGRPLQELTLPQSAAMPAGFQLHTYEAGRWRPWEQRFDFDASGRRDAHYLLDATTSRVHFGDGERGRVVPPRAPVLVAYHATQAAEGNLMSGKAALQLAENAHNQALLLDLEGLISALGAITMPFDATGGRVAETIDEATGRALDDLAKARRAVSVEDYQELAADTPGTHVARVAVKENYHPSFPCFVAPGVMTVLALPFLPAGQPFPSPGLRREVARYLHSRRILGTRIEVIGPTYKEVIVRAQVQACLGVDRLALQRQIVDRLHRYFNALPPGGPEGDGWPFSRDVYRSEVLQVLDEEPGVEHVLSLELLADPCEPACNNICVGPLGLVASGLHEIEVVS